MTAKGREIYLKESTIRKRNEAAARQLQETGQQLWVPTSIQAAVDRGACVCGGSISVTNGLMFCNKCGCDARVRLEVEP